MIPTNLTIGGRIEPLLRSNTTYGPVWETHSHILEHSGHAETNRRPAGLEQRMTGQISQPSGGVREGCVKLAPRIRTTPTAVRGELSPARSQGRHPGRHPALQAKADYKRRHNSPRNTSSRPDRCPSGGDKLEPFGGALSRHA